MTQPNGPGLTGASAQASVGSLSAKEPGLTGVSATASVGSLTSPQGLQGEIENAQRKVRTDAYQMSIGEIVGMYKEGELTINPDFQRLFRWEIGQKAKLIESLLLGIPIPSIFVFETEEAKWELIDGLQRISTILEFMGVLKNPDNQSDMPPSSLVATKYLTSLNNVVWQKSGLIKDVDVNDQIELEKSLQIVIRRARLGVEILKRPSDNNTKYDLFQRLNAGGTQANAQELRNCIIIMVDKAYFLVLKALANNEDFREVIAATDDQIERQRHLELATRFFVHNYIPYDGKLDLEEYIDEGIVALAKGGPQGAAESCFIDTFGFLKRVYGDNALRRYDGHRHSGRVGLSAFECIAVGIGKNIDAIRSSPNPEEFVRERVRSFWDQPELESFLSQGMPGTTRIRRTVPFGEKWFRP